MSDLSRPAAPIRVLVVCERLDITGGVERFVCEVASHLAGQGMAAAIGTVDTPRSAIRYPLHASVRALAGTTTPRPADDPAAGRFARGWQLLRAQWRTGRALARLIAAERPDVVVLNGLTTACSVLLFARRWAPHVICCDHNHFSARSMLWQRLRAWLYPKVGAVVSLTEADAAKFAALNRRTQVIYNASSLRAEEPALPSDPLVLAVGRHVAQKGFDLLIGAWPAVVKAVPAARLRVVGDGPLREQAVRLSEQLGIAASVEWAAPTDRIERHFREAAVFVLPSRYEGMPLALLEAQALGVPAVAFDCPTGPREIVTADTGIVVPALDVAALGQALTTLLTSPARRQRMAYAALQRSRAVFSPQAHVERWTALVRQVAEANRRAGRHARRLSHG